MMMANSPLADGSSLLPAVVGLVGAVIGGVSVAAASLLVAWQTRKAAERAWVKDNRRGIYDRFLTYAQSLLVACEECKDARRPARKAKANVKSAFTNFWEVYGVVQTVAEKRLFKAARMYGYRLWELATSLGSTSVMGPENFREVAELVRKARHGTIAAMRAELELDDSVCLDSDINPFEGTPLQSKYTNSNSGRSRPGPLAL